MSQQGKKRPGTAQRSTADPASINPKNHIARNYAKELRRHGIDKIHPVAIIRHPSLGTTKARTLIREGVKVAQGFGTINSTMRTVARRDLRDYNKAEQRQAKDLKELGTFGKVKLINQDAKRTKKGLPRIYGYLSKTSRRINKVEPQSFNPIDSLNLKGMRRNPTPRKPQAHWFKKK